ncbi:MAG: hypothetical protein IJX65_05505 [Alistipes sp.]|nr:hypothetical protein [Alistipes sp.]
MPAIEETKVLVSINTPYKLSNEIDENGRQFVLSSNGDIAFGYIGEDTGLTSAPILLSEGLITNKETNDGYGLVYIEARHGEQIRKAGYPSVLSFIEDVAKNFNTIRKGKDRFGNKTYLLQLTDRYNNTLMVELSGDGSYWNINTAGIFKKSYGKNNEIVYNRHTTDRQSAEIAGTSQSGEQRGTQPLSSMSIPTQVSESKDTTNIPNDQTSEESWTAIIKFSLPQNKKLIDITNNEQSSVASGFGTTPDTKSTTNSPISDIKDKRLLDIIQTNSKKYQ